MKYEWYPVECAPELYPVKVIGGFFSDENNNIITIIPTNEIINNGWSKINSTYIIGDAEKIIPSKLSITWFSFIENKFYKGDFNISKEKIENLFKEGFQNNENEKKGQFSRILIGLSPNGFITIWIVGERVRMEVDMLKANIVDLKWEDFAPETKRAERINSYLNDVLSKEEIIKSYKSLNDSIELNKYNNLYKKKVNIQYLFLNNFKFTRAELSYWNGEAEYLFNFHHEVSTKLNLIPKSINLNWTDSNNTKFVGEIVFDETEIFKAINLLYEKDPVAPISILIEKPIRKIIQVSIKNDKYIIDLSKVITRCSYN